MSAKNSNVTTVVTALVLCLVCSIAVSSVAVGLKPKQTENATLDFNKNVLIATGKFDPSKDTNSVVAERFNDFEVKMVNLETGQFATDDELQQAGIGDVNGYSVAKAARTPNLSTPLSDDIAGIGGKPKFSKVYIAKDANGQIEQLVLPIHGAGLWGQIYGLLTLDKDFNTIKGVNFYEHKETPGLGSRIADEPWRAMWVDKKTHNENGDVIMGVAKAGTATPEQVDGISGATLTGRGVHNMVQYWLGKDGYQPFLENLKAGKADGKGA